MKIIGAGLAGLLCGFMNPDSTIYEAGNGRNKHTAVLRMRTPEISRITGIPFKKKTVYKSIWLDGKEQQPSPRIGHMYSKKVIGEITKRSIMDISPKVRYIPPGDFQARLADRVSNQIIYNHKITGSDFPSGPVVSTVPMPVLMKMFDINMDMQFTRKSIYVSRYKIKNCDSYSTVYYPGRDIPIYRATLTGDILIIESKSCIHKDHSRQYTSYVLKTLGLVKSDIDCVISINDEHKFGKIYKTDEKKRRTFISNMTLHNELYSLGRYATWRPGVLLDDIVNDIFVIRKLVESDKYSVVNYNNNQA